MLLGESVLRVLFDLHGITPPRDIQYDRELGWTLIPGVHVWESALDYGVWVTTDADGLRVDEQTPPAANDARPTLLILGDSFAFGYGVAAHDAIAAALERELALAPTPYRVRTAGVPGYATDQELLGWRRLAARIRPRRIVLLFHESDLLDNTRASVVMGPERFFKPRFELHNGRLTLIGVPISPKERAAPVTMFDPLKAWMRPLAAYALVQAGMRRIDARRAVDAGSAVWVPPERSLITAELLSVLGREVRDSGADLTIAIASFDPRVASYMAAICAAEHLPAIDLSTVVAGKNVRLPHDGHWNARGHALAARAIAAVLQQRH